MKGKRGYVISYADWFKGFVIGALAGAVIVYLFMSGTLSLPAGLVPKSQIIIPALPALMKMN